MSEMITIGDGLSGHLARPAGEPRAALVVIHEVWGLTDHIKSVADRLATEGYLAFAPDLLSGKGMDMDELGGLQEGLFDPARRSAVQPKLRALTAPMQNPSFGAETLNGVRASFDYLYGLPEARQKVAVIGFCFGGTYSYSLAVAEPRLALAMPFYGHADFSTNELKRIKCPIRAFYGRNDDGLAQQTQDLPGKMAEAGVDFSQNIYDNCGHAFFNDTNKFAYNQAAADSAWAIVKAELAKI